MSTYSKSISLQQCQQFSAEFSTEEEELLSFNSKSHIGSFLSKRRISAAYQLPLQQKIPPLFTKPCSQDKKQMKGIKSKDLNNNKEACISSSGSDTEANQNSEEEASANLPYKGSRISNKRRNSFSKQESHSNPKQSFIMSTEDISLEPSTSATTTASNHSDEEMGDQDSEEADPSDQPHKKFKSNDNFQLSMRKDSFLSNSSETGCLQGINPASSILSPSQGCLYPSPPTEYLGASRKLSDYPFFLLDEPKGEVSRNHHQIKVEEKVLKRDQNEEVLRNNEHENKVEEVKKLIEQRMGRLAAEPINGFPCCTFSIRCFLKHTFVLSLDDLLNGFWCLKCQDSLQKVQSYAKQNNGELLSKFFTKILSFKCSQGHEWETSHLTYKQRWCQKCHRLVKDQFKQFIKDEEVKKQSEYEKSQKEIYREARRKALLQQSQNGEQQGDYKKKVISAAQQVEKEVEKIAESQAKEYIQFSQKGEENPCNFIQLKEMFKMLLFPESILQVYYSSLEEDILKSEYKNVARFIHPDKNYHSRAGESFQKLNRIYNIALPK